MLTFSSVLPRFLTFSLVSGKITDSQMAIGYFYLKAGAEGLEGAR
jgi:hypothetical protein